VDICTSIELLLKLQKRVNYGKAKGSKQIFKKMSGGSRKVLAFFADLAYNPAILPNKQHT
jgi:hypothetical protein